MRLKHIVKVNIADLNGRKQEVLQSERRSIPKRLLTFLFGDFCEVLVLTPGETVQGIYGMHRLCLRLLNFAMTMF